MPTPIDNLQPSLAITETIVINGLSPATSGVTMSSLGSIRHFAFDFAPTATMETHGELLTVAANPDLFNWIGTTFGGDGTSTFAIPDLDRALSVSDGQRPGFVEHVLGETFGSDEYILTRANMPPSVGGSSTPFDNNGPSVAMSYFITATGIYEGNYISQIGMVWESAVGAPPPGSFECNGQLLAIADYLALFSKIGTTFGGDGVTTFALPDLRNRAIIGVDSAPGSQFNMGMVTGPEFTTIAEYNLPTELGEFGVPVNNQAPSLVLRYVIALQGIFPSQGGPGMLDDDVPIMGEIVAYAGFDVPQGFAECAGQLLSIAQNTALFSLLGTSYGGNGVTTFALPDLRGRGMIGADDGTPIGTVLGDDIYGLTIDNIPDLYVTGTAGADTLYGANEGDTLLGQDGNDLLWGRGGNDVLTGGDGNDSLHGDAGADIMTGGPGDDNYWVDNAGDVVIEQIDEGTDTVRSTVSYSLGDNVENLILYGPAMIDATGNGLANIIFGNDAANVIDGGGGADSMRGGGGDDQYVVDNAGDRVLEGVGAGTDTVTSGVSFVLGPNVENLILSGSATINGNGNALANSLTGNGAANILNGLVGADTMTGGGGDDIYFVDDVGDVVVEAAAGGVDLVKSSISVTLGDNVEKLLLFGVAAIDGNGNALANTLTGNGAANALAGLGGDDYLTAGAGGDRLDGGAGNDQCIGGAGGDLFVFATALDAVANVDWIRDFSVADDGIGLDSTVFTAVSGVGPLSATEFRIGTAAADADDRIIYNSVNGFLYYDADGSGGGAQVQFARVAIGLAMTAADFIIDG